jgi:hypothetical protein
MSQDSRVKSGLGSPTSSTPEKERAGTTKGPSRPPPGFENVTLNPEMSGSELSVGYGPELPTDMMGREGDVTPETREVAPGMVGPVQIDQEGDPFGLGLLPFRPRVDKVLQDEEPDGSLHTHELVDRHGKRVRALKEKFEVR